MEKVVMPQNGIYHEGVEALAEALSENPALQHLDLNDNLLTPKGENMLTPKGEIVLTPKGENVLRLKGEIEMAKLEKAR